MEARLPEALVERIERLRLLDPVSERLQKVVRAVVPNESQRKDLLSGTWLGHPVHPLLTDAVVGAWTSAAILDVVGGEGAEQAADRLIAVGILAAGPTIATGASDWSELRNPSRRVGSVHAIGNSSALVLHALSWVARRRGDRRRGVALSLAGFGVAGFSAFLGGDLSFARGVGVNQTVFEDAPKALVVGHQVRATQLYFRGEPAMERRHPSHQAAARSAAGPADARGYYRHGDAAAHEPRRVRWLSPRTPSAK